jgi:hypothetical protein
MSVISLLVTIIGAMSRMVMNDMRKAIGAQAERLMDLERIQKDMEKQIEIDSAHEDYARDKLEGDMKRLQGMITSMTHKIEDISTKTLAFHAKYSHALDKMINKR